MQIVPIIFRSVSEVLFFFFLITFLVKWFISVFILCSFFRVSFQLKPLWLWLIVSNIICTEFSAANWNMNLIRFSSCFHVEFYFYAKHITIRSILIPELPLESENVWCGKFSTNWYRNYMPSVNKKLCRWKISFGNVYSKFHWNVKASAHFETKTKCVEFQRIMFRKLLLLTFNTFFPFRTCRLIKFQRENNLGAEVPVILFEHQWSADANLKMIDCSAIIQWELIDALLGAT